MTALMLETTGMSEPAAWTAQSIVSNRDLPTVHLISDAGPHPYFRTLIEAGGLDPASVVVGCVGPAGALQDEMRALGVRTFALGARRRAQYPIAIARLVRLLRTLRAPVVQTHLVDGSLVGLSAARLAGTPVAVFTAHHSHELPFHGRRVVWPDRLCAGPLCDHVIAPSREVADTLVAYTGIAPGKVEVVHHGFDLAALNPARVGGAQVRAELSLNGMLVFGAIGRSYRLKNHAAMMQAFARTLADVEEARLVIVGLGDSRPLAELASELGIRDRVLLAGPRPDIPPLLAAFDVFVHPALAESFGMVIVEAMAMARPVLSTPVGIAPEVIEDGVTGLLFIDGDVASLSAGFEAAMAARPRWAQIGASAHERVQGFTAGAMASRYQALYREWLAASPRRQSLRS